MKQQIQKTWTKKNIGIIIIVSFAYGIWFNFVDSAAYCNDLLLNIIDERCLYVGKLFGDNSIYQPWNIIGHFLPGLFLLLFLPKKIELVIVGVLISSSIMDSPLWGIMRISQGLPLWHMQGELNFVETNNFIEWLFYYYNPFGDYQVWKDPILTWLSPGLPTSALIFWSLIGRIIGSIILIKVEDKQDRIRHRFQ